MGTRVPLTYSSKDSGQNYTDKHIIGKLFLHTGNNRLYKVVGYIWNGDTDLWHIEYLAYSEDALDSDVKYTRSIQNFNSMRGDKPRFIKVEN